jgi:hypothetical protein
MHEFWVRSSVRDATRLERRDPSNHPYQNEAQREQEPGDRGPSGPGTVSRTDEPTGHEQGAHQQHKRADKLVAIQTGQVCPSLHKQSQASPC